MLDKILKSNKNKADIKAMSGVLELSPKEQIVFDGMKKKIASVYEKYGFIPLDVSTIERSEILFAKGGGDTEKEIYRIKKGDNDLALRFDLTVPLARYVAANYNEITFPFRRYQIGKVFRGERPQKGRFREFTQCDIDIIGDGELNIRNDAEIVSIIYSIFTKLSIGPFVVKVNNRKMLGGYLNSLGLSDKSVEILRVVDKLSKVGEDKVKELILELDIEENKVDAILKFVSFRGSNVEKLDYLNSLDISEENFVKGLEELETVYSLVKSFKVPEDYVEIDLSITRGLDYYTGTVYETFLIDNPEFGSICSGGRYDDLASYYINKELPGVGVSIGLTRLFSQLREKGLGDKQSTADLLILPLVDDFSKPIEVAKELREKGVSVEVYMEDRPMKKKFQYADKKGVENVLVIGEDEIKSGEYTLKNMVTGEQRSINLEELVNMLLIK